MKRSVLFLMGALCCLALTVFAGFQNLPRLCGGAFVMSSGLMGCGVHDWVFHKKNDKWSKWVKPLVVVYFLCALAIVAFALF